MTDADMQSTESNLALSTAPTDFTVIAAQSYGHGGSVFLHSLIDGHPDVLTLPATLGVQFYSSWAIQIGFMSPETIDFGRIRTLVLKFFALVYDKAIGYELGLSELGEGMDEYAQVDEQAFSRAFDFLFERLVREQGLPAKEELSARNVHLYRTVCLKSVYIAYAHCLGQDVARKKFLLYAAHGGPMLDIGALCEDHKDVRFVHMVREPVGNFDSIHRRLLELEQEKPSDPPIDPFWCVVNQIFYDRAPQAPVCGVPMYALFEYPIARPGRSVALRLEQLHRYPRETLTALCSWLGLEWSETLLLSTFAGKKWWNRPGWRRISGFSQSMTSRSPQLGAIDLWRLQWLAAPIDVALDYPGHRRSRVLEFLALAASLLLPYRLEFKAFSFRRYVYIMRRMWTKTPMNDSHGALIERVMAAVATPILFAGDLIRHRIAIVQGYKYNRREDVPFVPLLPSGPMPM